MEEIINRAVQEAASLVLGTISDHFEDVTDLEQELEFTINGTRCYLLVYYDLFYSECIHHCGNDALFIEPWQEGGEYSDNNINNAYLTINYDSEDEKEILLNTSDIEEIIRKDYKQWI